MEKPFTRVGKQIMASGTHYADAADETAAQFTVDALNAKACDGLVTRKLVRALSRITGMESDTPLMTLGFVRQEAAGALEDARNAGFAA